MNSITNDQYPIVVRNDIIRHADVYKNVNVGFVSFLRSTSYGYVPIVLPLEILIQISPNTNIGWTK